jgi:catechol 2,3-dioxygenase-like lactoylglutathione lyase family enzyme
MRFLEMHIETADLEKALEFYSRLIPHEKVVRWKDDSAAALVMPDGRAFGIWREGKRGIHDGRGAKHLHFAFQIDPAEYAEYKARLEASGTEVLEHDWPNGHKSMYFFDADGHQGELMTCDWLGLSGSD